MPRYRKKPVVVEAVRWSLGEPAPPGLCVLSSCSMAPDPHVHTLEGPLHVSPGDYIIRGLAGEYYPCDAHIFEQTYEPVESD